MSEEEEGHCLSIIAPGGGGRGGVPPSQRAMSDAVVDE